MFKLWPQPSQEIRKKEIFYSHCHIFSFFHPTLSPPLHVTRDGDISNAAVIDCTVLYCTVLYYTVLCCIVIMMLSDWTRARTRGWTRRSSPRTRWRRPSRRWQGAEIESFNMTPLNPSYTFYIHITFPVGWSHRGHGGRVCQYWQERWRQILLSEFIDWALEKDLDIEDDVEPEDWTEDAGNIFTLVL